MMEKFSVCARRLVKFYRQLEAARGKTVKTRARLAALIPSPRALDENLKLLHSARVYEQNIFRFGRVYKRNDKHFSRDNALEAPFIFSPREPK